MKKIIVFIFIALSLPIIVISQQFKRIGTSDGLSNNTIVTIMQDNKGYMWFGTDDGLNRYDGNSFTVFKPDFKYKNSISHSISNVLFEDSKGRIWIGSDGGGLSVYYPQKEKFENFYFDAQNEKSLSHDIVSAITEDKNNTIWIGTYGGGLNRYNEESKTFTHFKNEATNSNTISSDYINCLIVDEQNLLWIGTWKKGLCRYDKTKKEFKNYSLNHGNNITETTVNCLLLDSNNKIWIGTWGEGLNQFDKYSETFTNFKHIKEDKNSISHNIVRSICKDAEDNLWIGTFGGGLNSLNTKTNVFTSYVHDANDVRSISNNKVWFVYSSNDNNIWAGTINGGLNQLDLLPQKFNHVQIFDDYPANNVFSATSITQTKSNEILVSAGNKGVFKCDTGMSFIENLFDEPSLKGLLQNNSITSIIEDKFGEYWIGSTNGLIRFNPYTKYTNHYKHVSNSTTGLSFITVIDLCEDHLGDIWIATWGGGLNKYNRETNRFEYFLPLKKVKVKFMVDMTGIKVSDEGVFLAGSMNGWNPSADKLTLETGNIYSITKELYPIRTEYKFLNGNTIGSAEQVPRTCSNNSNRIIFPGNQNIVLDAVLFGKGCNEVAIKQSTVDLTSDEKVFSSNRVYSIYEDREGVLWVGTNYGLNKFNRITNSFTIYKNKRGDTTSLSHNHVSCIYEDITGQLWVGTLGGGLNRFNKANSTFTCLSEHNGLANNSLHSIHEDTKGNLWLSTNVGITRFNKESLDFRNYTSTDGLEDYSFQYGASLVTEGGMFLFGGSKGLVQFNPEEFTENKTNSSVILTDLYLANKRVTIGKQDDGRTILNKSLLYAKEIKLRYRDRIFSIHFTSPQFLSSENLTFAYKLEGFEDEWQFTDSKSRVATYTNLEGGDYVFMVKVSRGDNQWFEPTSIKLTISPPFWKTHWFVILVVILIAAIIYFWYKIKVINKRKELLQEQTQKEKKIIELEKNKLELEIELKNVELGKVTIQMVSKRKFMTDQINQLKTAKITASNNQTKEKLSKLITKLNKEIKNDKDWEFVELHFDKVYQGFIKTLKDKYPNLSSNDIKLAAYIRMGLSSKEISALMNTTLRGVESRRYRLRKEFGLDSCDNLSDFLFKLDEV